MAATSNFQWNQAALYDIRLGMTKGLLRMGNAVAAQARSNAPVLTGALRNSIRVTADRNDTVYILAGGSVSGKTVPYALYREFHNKKHPETTHYMAKALTKVANQDISQYFKELI